MIAAAMVTVVAIATVGWVGAAIATSVAMVLKTGLSYHYIRSLISFSVPVREILLEGVAALVMGGCLWLFAPAGVLALPSLVFWISVGAAVYTVAVLALIERIRVEAFAMAVANARALF